MENAGLYMFVFFFRGFSDNIYVYKWQYMWNNEILSAAEFLT